MSMSMPGMNMGGSNASMGHMGMTSYFHFGINDQLWFKEWVPQSGGAFFGSCIGLFLFAIVERFVAGLRGVMELWWRRKAEELLKSSRAAPLTEEPCHIDVDSDTPEKDSKGQDDSIDSISISTASIPRASVAALPSRPIPDVPFKRTLPPFIPSHDIPRGVLQAVHSAIGYALMLAVMMFNAGWFISIVVGLGVGEILFGRYSNIGH